VNAPSVAVLRRELRHRAKPGRAEVCRRFFKTGPGEYGEGDVFIGVTVPELRKVARLGRDLSPGDAGKLLHSEVHEERQLALFILVTRFGRTDEAERKLIYRLYLDSTEFINNWDLVDCSAEHVVGAYLLPRSRRPLHRLARSKDLWERRIAIMATFHFIKRGEFDETLALADTLFADPEDLIHKAVGWMLREVGNRDRETEERFLKDRYKAMPRTMLRYAIEKFPELRRQAYLKGRV